MIEDVSEIRSRLDFADYVDQLRAELTDKSIEWQNEDLESFLEAMSAWVRDMDGVYRNRVEEVPQDVPWDVFAQILLSASACE